MLGLAFALKQEGALDGLCGRIKLCLVPAEEGIEIGYRKELIKKGIIKYTTGKPEFISRGYFDDLDVYNYNDKWLSSSTDMGDVSVLIPSIHFYANNSSGTEHGIDYKIVDAYNTCVNSAKIEYKLLRNLLSNNAKKRSISLKNSSLLLVA